MLLDLIPQQHHDSKHDSKRHQNQTLSLTLSSPFPWFPLPRSCANATSQILYFSSGWGVPVIPFFQQRATAQQNSCAECGLTGDRGVLAEHIWVRRLRRWRQSYITGWHWKRRWPQCPIIFEAVQAEVLFFPTRIIFVEEQMVRRRKKKRFLFFSECYASLLFPHLHILHFPSFFCTFSPPSCPTCFSLQPSF